MIQKFSVSRDDSIYEAWPDVALTPSGKLVCVFSECTHHGDRSYTRLMLCDSADRGRTWTPKRPLTEGTRGVPFWNCARIGTLRDGRLYALADLCHAGEGRREPNLYQNYLFFSEDEGKTWTPPVRVPAEGIVPDKLCELDTGRWLCSCHTHHPETGNLYQRLWYSDDQGKTWSDSVVVGEQKGLNLCEVSILPFGIGTLVAFFRENSGEGWDAYKTISHNSGETWGAPIRFPLPGCQNPRKLLDGKIGHVCRIVHGPSSGARGRMNPRERRPVFFGIAS